MTIERLLDELKEQREALTKAIDAIESVIVKRRPVQVKRAAVMKTVRKMKKAKKAKRAKRTKSSWTPERRERFLATMRAKGLIHKHEEPAVVEG